MKAEKELITFLLERHGNKYDEELERCLQSNDLQEKRAALNLVTMKYTRGFMTDSTYSFGNETPKSEVELPEIKSASSVQKYGDLISLTNSSFYQVK